MDRLVNQIGNRFSRWTVIKPEERNKHGAAQWLCRCDCGNEKVINDCSLKRGDSKSCGCLRLELLKTRLVKDISGQRYGLLVAVSRVLNTNAKRGSGSSWLCQCDCGRQKITLLSSLQSGDTKSCGCLSKTKTRTPSPPRTHIKTPQDLTGQKFGYWTVTSKAPRNKHNHLCWNCICDCGTQSVVVATSLKCGDSSSCGCYKKKAISKKRLIDLTGHRIGRWTVIEQCGKNSFGSILWLCRNDDGRIWKRSAANLITESDPTRLFVRRVRSRIYLALKKSLLTKSHRSLDILGCSGAELAYHLSQQFYGPMTIDNHGSVWHIDHIIPIASFDLSDPEQVKKCFHYTNLQPLMIKHNLSKGDRLDWVHPNKQAINQGA